MVLKKEAPVWTLPISVWVCRVGNVDDVDITVSIGGIGVVAGYSDVIEGIGRSDGGQVSCRLHQ